MKFKLDKSLIQKIGRDKLIIIGGALAVIILCLLWESSGDGNKETKEDGAKTEAQLNNYGAGETQYMEKYVKSLEERLAGLLSGIEGVGKVKVMITVNTSVAHNLFTEKNISKEDTDEKDNAGGTRKVYTYSETNNTVYVTDQSGNTYPYVVSDSVPIVEGVAVVAQGAESAVIKQKIINVIKALFPLDVNKITVE